MCIEFSRPLVVTVVSAMIAIVDSRVGGGFVDTADWEGNAYKRPTWTSTK